MEPVNNKTNNLPPSYDEATGTLPTISQYQNELLQYIAQLPDAVRQSQEDHQRRQDRRDVDFMSQMVPDIGAFLTRIASLPTQPMGAELILIPESSVPEGWELSGISDRRKEGDIIEVVRVRTDEEGLQNAHCAKTAKTSGSAESAESAKKSNHTAHDQNTTGMDGQAESGEFDEWGRWWPVEPSSSDTAERRSWWRDEGLARRLATYLSQSLTPKSKTDLVLARSASMNPANLKQKEKEKGSGSWLPWGKKKSKQSTRTSSSRVDVPNSGGPRARDAVWMRAQAEEVTFRQENEFGIYESMTGWGVVLRVTAQLSP